MKEELLMVPDAKLTVLGKKVLGTPLFFVFLHKPVLFFFFHFIIFHILGTFPYSPEEISDGGVAKHGIYNQDQCRY